MSLDKDTVSAWGKKAYQHKKTVSQYLTEELGLEDEERLAQFWLSLGTREAAQMDFSETFELNKMPVVDPDERDDFPRRV